MKVLVIYATVEGQTGKVARFVAAESDKLGHQTVLIDADDPTAISFSDIDAVVLAASVHQRRHPRNFEALLTAHAQDLSRAQTLLLSVSLSAAFPEGLEEAREYVTEMEMRTGVVSDQNIFVGGAIKTAEYDYFALQVVRHVVMRDRPFDPSENEHEFTDWDVLRAEISEFLG